MRCEVSANEKIIDLTRLLNGCLADGESVSSQDQEVIILLFGFLMKIL